MGGGAGKPAGARVTRRSSSLRALDEGRAETPVEEAVVQNWSEGQGLVRLLPVGNRGEASCFVPDIAGALFCGHLVTDLDSIAGAIGGAALYGGVPARASEINSETEFALKHWGCELPAPIEDLVQERPDRSVCLVDFQQQSQLNPAIPMGNIVGIIDHHALQSNTIVTERPIFVDIRPWGCMSAIIAHSFAVNSKFLPRNVAGLLLSAILSDTLNLRSPTTTEWDRRVLSMLVQYTGVQDVNRLAEDQFRAKSRQLSLMSPHALVVGDLKQFKFTPPSGGKEVVVGYAVAETTDAAATMARAAELLPEMRAVRQEQQLAALLLAVVDIVNLRSELLMCGMAERSLAAAAYGGEPKAGGEVLDLGGLVSRKKDLIPPLSRAVKEGWTAPLRASEACAAGSLDAGECVAQGQVTMDYSTSFSGLVVRKGD